MVHKIMTGAGFTLNVTYRETRFMTPPKETYAVYNDSFRRRGGDYFNALKEHDVTIEVYEYAPDPEAETAIEEQFDRIGMEFEKQERYWIEEEQLYQIIYSFSYLTKED